MSEIKRYSKKDLEEFKKVIEAKLEKSTKQYNLIMDQIIDFNENTSGDYTKDISDFSSSQGEVEMLNKMANRQHVYINDLQAALVRIRNKTYGICFVSGELIDKRRLLAVPTTTKSLSTKKNEGSVLKAPLIRTSIHDGVNKPKK